MASKHQTITFSKKDIVEPAKKLLHNKGYPDFGNNKENGDEYNSKKGYEHTIFRQSPKQIDNNARS